MSNTKPAEKKEQKDGFVIVFPHKKVSAKVTEKNVSTVQADAEKMLDLCENITNHPKESGIISLYALGHSQVVQKPIRFFVLNFHDQKIKSNYFDEFPPVIINPELIEHTKVPQSKEEGCASFPAIAMARVPRYTKGVVRYQTIKDFEAEKWEIGTPVEVPVNGLICQLFQHEIDHMNAIYVNDPDKVFGKK